jgi:hypothetical protein
MENTEVFTFLFIIKKCRYPRYNAVKVLRLGDVGILKLSIQLPHRWRLSLLASRADLPFVQ